MKKITLLFLIHFLSLSIFANDVSKDLAISTSYRLIKIVNPSFQYDSVDIEMVHENDKNAYYIVNYKPEGWALISANDESKPLIGYSTTDKYIKQNQPSTMKAWIKNYANEIVQESNVRLKRHKEWYSTKSILINQSSKISPLIKVNWNQSYPYNQFCPSDADGTALVGCVAVAMAQAVSVAKYPNKPNGEHSYYNPRYGNIYLNYDEESPYDWNKILNGSDGKKEIARFLYHCGVAVDMGYSPTGSGTQTSYIPRGLRNYFDYSKSVKSIDRDYYEGDWEKLILNELKNGRAVVYSGYDGVSNYGHAFNLDGYDGNRMYHVNWGWGGSNNGYFTIDGLKDQTMNMNYTQNHTAIIGIRPTFYGPSDILLDNNVIKANIPAGTVVGNIIVESDLPDQEYSYNLKGSYNLILEDYNPSAFKIENNQLITKKSFKDIGEIYWVTLYIKAINKNNELSLEKEFQIKINPNASYVTDDEKFKDFNVLYNNEYHRLQINIKKHNKYFARIVSSNGKICYQNYINYGDNIIPTNNLNHGVYILQVKLSNNENYSEKIIIN